MSDSSDDDFGPQPPKKLKSDDSESEDFGPRVTVDNSRSVRELIPSDYLQELPTALLYEKSFQHRSPVIFVLASNQKEFIVSVSVDGSIKFWKKRFEGVEFVKTIETNVSMISCSLSTDGSQFAAVSESELFLFDIENFNLLTRQKFADLVSVAHLGNVIAVGDKNCCVRLIRDNVEIGVFKGHTGIVKFLACLGSDSIISVDVDGGIEVWSSVNLSLPESVSFKSKLDTDMYLLKKRKVSPLSLAVGFNHFAIFCSDGRIRVFHIKTCKLFKEIDESIECLTIGQTDPNMKSIHLEPNDFNDRVTREHQLTKNSLNLASSVIFDKTGDLLIYSTLVGVKVVDIKSNRLLMILGKSERSERFLSLALYQGPPIKLNELTGEGESVCVSDPTLICSAYEKDRVYFFTRRLPKTVRDVFNEKPVKKAISNRLDLSGKEIFVKTTKGDFTIQLFSKEVPKSCENFIEHCKTGYLDKCIFHRVIKGFMIQSGDPTGTGTGGESIWGGYFEDEFKKQLRHDRPYTVSMANSGPNTNGSQFFITTVPCPWLDNKHTVIGRVNKGHEVVLAIENAKVDAQDKPLETIRILSTSICKIDSLN